MQVMHKNINEGRHTHKINVHFGNYWKHVMIHLFEVKVTQITDSKMLKTTDARSLFIYKSLEKILQIK
jgi:hypothetical protein